MHSNRTLLSLILTNIDLKKQSSDFPGFKLTGFCWSLVETKSPKSGVEGHSINRILHVKNNSSLRCKCELYHASQYLM